jgi:LmbE family N-acetylglucosaminyl deacetylase
MTTNLYSDLADGDTGELAPERVLAIGAHPDDVEFGCGGTLAKWAAAGAEVTMVIVTDGSKGTWDRSVDPTDLAELRRTEQQRAADRLGVANIVLLDHTDGELEYTMALRAELCLQIRTYRPDVLLSHDPWMRYQLHPDHRATGMGAVDGMVAARDHLFFPEQGVDAHRPSAMLLWSADVADHYEDITMSFSTKLDALLEHSSQSTTTMAGAADDDARRSAFEERLRSRASDAGAQAGIELAEAFKRLKP